MKPNIRLFSLQFLVLSLLYQTSFSDVSCPKGCYCLRNMIDCRSPDFPMQLPNRAIDVMSIRGTIPKIPANAFIQPSNSVVKSLSINQNEIFKIESYAFNNLVVDDINFYNVKIKYFEPRIFHNLTCSSISIYNLAVDVMPSFLFEGLTSDSLNIYNANITTLETNVFKSATISKNAAFYHNNVMTVQRNAFSASFLFNIYLNKFQIFIVQDNVRPKSFHSNKFQCACGLIWMWKSNSIFRNYLDRNTCMGPTQLAGVALSKLDQSSLCDGVDMSSSNTSGWESITETNTNNHGSSHSTGGGTVGGGTVGGGSSITGNPTDPASTANQRNASKKLAMNVVMIVLAVTCFFVLL